MKNLLLLLSVVVLFISCEKIEDNSNALQADVDNVLFKADLVRGEYYSSGNYFLLEGNSNDEVITIRASYPPANVLLEFDEESVNYATFKKANGIVYSTQNVGGGGSVIINNISTSNRTITGDFNFTAISQSQDTITVSGGLFYGAKYIIVE